MHISVVCIYLRVGIDSLIRNGTDTQYMHTKLDKA